jgi:RNA polymerase sigma-70 factor (ECF subfamily)
MSGRPPHTHTQGLHKTRYLDVTFCHLVVSAECPQKRGTFRFLASLPVVEAPQVPMQEMQPALVLQSEVLLPKVMDETPSSSQQETPEPQAAATDEQLMLDFAKGQGDAFTDLFQRYKQPIFGFFRRRIGDAAQAEELTQETFIAILRGAARYQPQALFRTYLYAIAFKILRAQHRKTAFRATFLGQWKGMQDPAAKEAAETELMLREALRKLDGTDREILMLREFEQLSYAEIAELLKIPVNTVRSRLFRARMALRELLTAQPQKSPAAKLAGFEERV